MGRKQSINKIIKKKKKIPLLKNKLDACRINSKPPTAHSNQFQLFHDSVR
jgi:hypothetical protein